MHADELRMAVRKIVEILEKSEVRAVVDQYRTTKGDQRTAATARLGHAGAVLMENIDAMSSPERQVLKCLHLESLGSADYWQGLLAGSDDAKKHQGDIVRLASRIMFASSHLPGMVGLMDAVKAPQPSVEQPLEAGEGRLSIRLTDAGERASDPDRVARAIDGLDMLYSACASIARKPAMDLRIDGIVAKRNQDRDLHFTGERDGIAATFAVIDSIPAALAEIDPDQDIDLDAIVRSLPVFEDLNTLAALGTFSSKDLKDISDTMHQGALLTLESGIILIDPASDHTDGASESSAPALASVPGVETFSPVQSQDGNMTQGDQAPERDEHYDRYLREREAMLRPQATTANSGHSVNGAVAGAVGEDNKQADAVDELLKALGQSRSS